MRYQAGTSFLGQPILFELINYSREVVGEYISGSQRFEKCPSSPESCEELLILQIDHIRDARVYQKTVSRWVGDLELRGRFIICPGRILLVLEGSADDLKSYEKRHRTQIVDVDSRGRPCKEKMLTVIFKERLREGTFTDFQIMEVSSVHEQKEFFEKRGLSNVYKQCF